MGYLSLYGRKKEIRKDMEGEKGKHRITWVLTKLLVGKSECDVKERGCRKRNLKQLYFEKKK